MQKVPLNNEQLDYLAYEHLGSIYGGTLPCDRLPMTQDRAGRRAFIVNTDPHDRPGTHWVALWTDRDECELFDSIAMPLGYYKTAAPLEIWIERHYLTCASNADAVQAITNQTCGYYCLFYLLAKHRGQSMSTFLTMFDTSNYLANDELVATMMRQLIKHPKEWSQVCQRSYRQCNK